MQELDNFRVPDGVSSALARDPAGLRLPQTFTEGKLGCAGSSLSTWNPSQGLCGLRRPPGAESENCWNNCGGARWGAEPQRLLPQSSCLSLSQSMRWTGGGLIVESHAASTRIVCAGQPPAEVCERQLDQMDAGMSCTLEGTVLILSSGQT